MKKRLEQQIAAMRAIWPEFTMTRGFSGQAIWFGSLVGVARSYRVMVEYDLPNGHGQEMWRRFPVVRVMSPQLEARWQAPEEAPLPHVFFDKQDITFSPLCLFDPDLNEWTHRDLIARTTIYWAADWLACYEVWLATGRWRGGGRHAGQAAA